MSTVTISFPKGSVEPTPELLEKLKHDLETAPVRALTQEERAIYGRAVQTAVEHIPAFRDGISLMRPYLDATAPTAYTDRYARVGLSYWFLHLIPREQQAAVILHEAMHVLNNHFAREEEIGTRPDLYNIAGDLEINTILARVPYIDLGVGIYPNKAPYSYPTGQTMEYYHAALREDFPAPPPQKGNGQGDPQKGDGQGQGQGQGNPSPGDESQGGPGSSSQGSGGSPSQEQSAKGSGGSKDEGAQGGQPADGTSWACGPTSEETEAKADAAGISRASELEKTIAKQNTLARILDEKVKSKDRNRGTQDMSAFFDVMLQHLSPAKVDWRQTLRQIFSLSKDAISRGRSDYSYRRGNRRAAGSEFVMPGLVKYNPTAMLAVDTSGSMGNEDYQKLLVEVEDIVKNVSRGKGAVKIFSVDTKVGNIQPVSSVKQLNLTGGGGTIMAVAFRYVSALQKRDRPDLFVLSTDGFIDWEDVQEELKTARYKSIILVTTPEGFKQAPEGVHELATVLDIS